MSKADVIEIEGKVVEKLPNAFFKVELENGCFLNRHSCIRQLSRWSGIFLSISFSLNLTSMSCSH